MDLEARIQRLEARADLAELVAAYCLYADNRDVARLTGIFAPDGAFRHGDGSVDIRGRDQIAEFFRTRQASMGISIHSVHGSVLHSLDAAHAEATVQGSVQVELHGRTVVGMMRYQDSYTKIDGQWLFADRCLSYWYSVPAEDVGTVLAKPLRRWWPGEPTRTVLPSGIPTWQAFYAPG